ESQKAMVKILPNVLKYREIFVKNKWLKNIDKLNNEDGEILFHYLNFLEDNTHKNNINEAIECLKTKLNVTNKDNQNENEDSCEL
ncbi:MAG: hypothetical protein MHPSP_003476, partial [Paramarteilia canceri]